MKLLQELILSQPLVLNKLILILLGNLKIRRNQILIWLILRGLNETNQLKQLAKD